MPFPLVAQRRPKHRGLELVRHPASLQSRGFSLDFSLLAHGQRRAITARQSVSAPAPRSAPTAVGKEHRRDWRRMRADYKRASAERPAEFVQLGIVAETSCENSTVPMAAGPVCTLGAVCRLPLAERASSNFRSLPRTTRRWPIRGGCVAAEASCNAPLSNTSGWQTTRSIESAWRSSGAGGLGHSGRSSLRVPGNSGDLAISVGRYSTAVAFVERIELPEIKLAQLRKLG
jgi:hypothetical protein